MRKLFTILLIVAAPLLSPGQWALKSLSTTTDLHALEYSNASNIWIAGNTDIYVSSNGGTSFSTVTPKDNNNVNLFGSTFKDFHAFSATTAAGCGLFYTGNNHTIPKTTNGGVNWTWGSISTSFMAMMFDLDFPTPTIGYCVGRDGRLEKSIDGGASWSPQVSNTTEFIYAVKFFDALNGIAVGYHVILTTHDAGANWTPHVISSYLKSIDILGTNTAIAVGDSGNGKAVIMKTINSGNTWTHISNPFPEAEDVRIFGTDTIILATRDNLYRSVDGGAYWDEYITPATSSHFYKIDFINSQNGWAIGTSGYCIYTNNGGTVRPFSVVSASSTGTVCEGATVNFTNSSKPSYTFSWYLDGNLVNHNYNFSNTFNAAGNHSVLLVASDGVNSDSSSFTFNVIPSINIPALQINAVIDSMCWGQGTGIEIFNSDPTVDYQLKKGAQILATAVGNGATLTMNTGNVNVTTTYTVRANKYNQCFADSEFASATVIVVTPDNSLPVLASKPLYCWIDSAYVLVLNSQPWVKYSLNSQFNPFYHGNGDTLIIPTGEIATNGSHTEYVYAKSDFGCQNNLTNHATITGLINYTQFRASHWSVVQGDSITFDNLSNGNSFQWTFGAGASLASSTDSIPPPIYYNTVGTSTATLIGSNIAGCIDTFSSEITVVNPVLPTPLEKCMSGILPGKYFVNDYYVDRFGNSYLTGFYFFSYYMNDRHFFVAKMDANQNILWVKEEQYDFWLESTYGNGVIADDSGNTYMCGNFFGTNFHIGNFTLLNPGGAPNGFIVKYDTNGVEQWVIGGQQGAVYFADMAIDSLNNIYVSGTGSSGFKLNFTDGSVTTTTPGKNFILIIDPAGVYKDMAKFDWYTPNGNIRCGYSSGTTGDCTYAVGPKIKVLRNGKVALAGATPGGHTKIFGPFTIVNQKPSIYYAEYEMYNNWTKAFIIAEASTMDDELQAFDVDHNGNIYVIGKAQDTLFYDGNPVVLYNEPFREFTESYLIKCDSTGNSTYMTHTRFGFFHDIDVKSDDHIILTTELYRSGAFEDVAGYDYGIRSKGDNDYALIEYDENGNLQWAQRYGGNLHDFPYWTQLDECDDAYVCASIDRTWSRWPDIYHCGHPCPEEGFLGISKVALDGNCSKINCVPVANDLPPLTIQAQFVVVFAGDFISVDIVAGDSLFPVDSVYGISFDISFTSSMIVPGSIAVTYPPSFLGMDGLTTTTSTNIGTTISGSVTRTTGTDTAGYGKIAKVTMRVVPGTPSGSLVHLNFNGYYSHMLNNDSVYFNLFGESVYVSTTTSVKEAVANSFKIYPNPAQDKITIESQFNSGEVVIVNAMGVECLRSKISNNREEISLKGLSGGIYFVSVWSKERVITERLVIVK